MSYFYLLLSVFMALGFRNISVYPDNNNNDNDNNGNNNNNNDDNDDRLLIGRSNK